MSGLSVILSSYNQFNTIRKVFRSYENQSCRPAEVIVVDDGSSDGTLDWLDSASFAIPVSYVTRQHSWYRLASLNNLGASLAVGDRLLFTNADQLHCPSSFVSHMVLNHDAIGAGIFKGIKQGNEVTMNMIDDFSQVEWLQQQYPSLKTNMAYVGGNDPIGVWGGNISVSKKMFDAINGYDEGYDVGWGGEENDLVRRLVKNGAALRWAMDSVIYHLDHRIKAYAKTRLGSWRYARGSA